MKKFIDFIVFISGGFVVRFLFNKYLPDSNAAIDEKNKDAAGLLGFLERIGAAISFCYPEAIAAWLVFKIGSKWVWQSKIEYNFTENEFQKAWQINRRKEMGVKYLRFLIGTLLNILIGLFYAIIFEAAII